MFSARRLCYSTGALGSTFYIFVGPDLFGGGPANNILRGPCQQLLTGLTFKPATELRRLTSGFMNHDDSESITITKLMNCLQLRCTRDILTLKVSGYGNHNY